MELITNEIREQLLANAAATHAAQIGDMDEPDHTPVMKLFLPVGGATWLITEMDPENNDILYGLCDLGQGYPELGYVSLTEISQPLKVPVLINGQSVRMPTQVERDIHFKATKTLSAYTSEANEFGTIRA